MNMIMTRDEFLNKKYANEDQFTADSFRYINNNYPELRNFFFHIPNESQFNQHHVKGKFNAGDRHRILMASMGVMPGIPDFLFLKHWDTIEYDTFRWWMELKLPSGSLSGPQKKIHSLWEDWGEMIFVCKNPAQVIETCIVMLGDPNF